MFDDRIYLRKNIQEDLMNKQFLNEINDEYNKLELKEAEIFHALFHRIFDLESHWYSGHYYKDDNGKWFLTSYPIPVIDVKGFCDIEVGFDKISISTKLKREKALTYSFKKFENYEFEAYGVNNYLLDFYHSGQSLRILKDNVNASDEEEIGFSFVFPFDVEGKEIFEFVKLLRREGFYY